MMRLGLLSALACAGIVACTTTVRTGTYGPLEVGDDKATVLSKLEQRKLYPTPVPYDDYYFEKPSEADLQRLTKSDGIDIWLEHHPNPLRVEFSEDKVTRTWPKMDAIPRGPPSMQRVVLALSQLQDQIHTGASRQEVFQLILNFGRTHPIAVGNFIVGNQELRDFRGTPAHRDLLLRNDAWTFDGLKELTFNDPYYSRVKLFFRDGHLERIEHWTFPYERL